MADDDEWKKLPTDQKVAHKAWKARAAGYQECIKSFPTLDEKSPEFSKYLGLIKKFVTDSNQLNRIQGVEAANLFVQNAHVAGKTVSEVVGGVVLQCFNSKPKLKEMGIDLILNYIEIDKPEQVMEELIKGFENKQPKIVNSCVECATKALSEFGSKVVHVKSLMSSCKKLVDHRDKAVRQSTKLMIVEIYRWIKDAIRVPLQSINAVVLKELESEWNELKDEKTKQQTRFMRSQQDLREKFEQKQSQAVDGSSGGGDARLEDEVEEQVDPYDLMEPVDILSKLPKTFYDEIEAKKWQERKKMLDVVEKLSENPRLAQGDYADLLKALKKVVAKDTNIMLVTVAIKCIGGIARGLRNKFQPYALLCLESMFERFKEKKATVLQALKDATDAAGGSIPITNMQDSLLEYLAHKNPSVRAHVGHFVSRMVMKMRAQQLNKTLLKTLLAPLIKNLSDGTPDVRDGSYAAIAACMTKIGEAKITPFLADLDKIKMDKIRDSAAKLSPAAVASGGDAGKEVKKPAAPAKDAPAAKKQPPAKKSSSAASVKSTGAKKSAAAAKSSSKPAAKKEETFDEMELGEDDVISKFDDMFSSDIKSQILNSVWKERFAGLQAAHAKLKIMSSEQIACQAIVKFLAANKPGYKDSNFNCLNEKFAILKYLAENSFFSIKSVDSCLSSLVDKVGDIKCGPASRDCLSSICEATSFPKISQQIVEYGMSQKNPKVQSETLKWLANALVEFGIDGVDTKFVIKHTKSALSHTNMAVRKGALDVVRSLAMFLGEMVKNLFGDEKAALLQQINQQVEAVKGEAKPKPIRGKKSKSSSSGAGGNDGDGDDDDDVDDDDDEAGGGQLNMEDLLPRVDISGKITDELLSMLGDSKWKDRKQALDNIVDILNQAKYIENKLGDLPQELKKRFKDSNKLLLITTLEILTQLGEALGSKYLHEHLPTFLEGIVTSLADSKPKVRQTALACMEKWAEKSKLTQWFNNDEIASCLANPRYTFLRIELMKWLGEKLLKCKPFSNPAARENVELCVKHVFQCCEDRNSDVRSSAAEILPALIYHLNYKKMLQLANKMPASSKNAIVGLIESANEKVPKAQPKAAKATASAGGDEKKVVRPASSKAGGDAAAKMKSDEASVKKEEAKKEEGKKSALKKPGSGGTSSQKGGKSAAAPEDSVGAFIAQKNGKELRYKEERQLKVLKWAFAAPRDELLQQLRQQMSLCINPNLLADMFHQDSNKHKKVIDKLNQSLTSEWKGTIDNFDVILRWYTIRFYDNNTTIHLKSFEYLHNLFRKVQQADLKLSDYEALAFLPHLIIKIGDSKENIRNNVHSLLELMMETYDEKKIYQQIMIGTKSKNAKQRTGCLDVIGKLIRKYSTSVCDPTLPKACKDIAAFISDRDKTVRDSALNAIVCVYEDVGELAYKCVGKLNEKDLSMLEERIKRSANKPKSQPASRPQTSASALNQSKLQPKTSSKQQPKQQEESAVTSSNQQQQQQPSTTTAAAAPAYQPLGLPEDVQALMKKISDVEEKLQGFNNDEELPHYEAPDWLKNKETSPAAKETIDLVISRLVSNDNSACLKAVHEMYEIMRKICDKGEYDLLTDCVGQLITSAARKFRMLKERSLPEVISSHSSDETKAEFLRLSQSYFTVVNMVFKSRELLKCATYYELYDFLRSIMSFMVDPRLKKVQDCDMFIKSINVATFEVANNTDPLLLVCATIKLVDDALTSAPYLKSYKEKGDEEAMRNTLEYYHIALKLHVRVIKRITNPKPEDVVYGNDKLSDLFVEIDSFWSKYPLSSQFTAIFADNMPLIKSPYKDAAFMLKTLKTTQTAVYERLKQQVIPHLHGVASNRSSHTMTFMCKKFSLDYETLKNQVSQHQESRKSSSSSSNDKPPVTLASKLDDIFKKIKKTDTFDQAMVELFEFQRQHPHHDVEAKIESLELNCFKNYVRSNLKIMAIEKNENIDESAKRTAVCDEIVSKMTDNKNIINDINQLRACCGLNPLQEDKPQLARPQKSLLKPMASREPSKLSAMTSSSSIASSRGSSKSGGGGGASLGSNIPTTTTSNHNFSDLKKRFQALKDRANLKNN